MVVGAHALGVAVSPDPLPAGIINTFNGSDAPRNFALRIGGTTVNDGGIVGNRRSYSTSCERRLRGAAGH
ncbi:hypothetical protein DWU99_05640 [Dyella psychrodurans]|uniref:Uncharacterized protein n=1 Tax=Dyella psychrodurans TaxID=1927960 RepID=A0A370XER9_9GAMM|nr:hypothetical protein DWU99_05640 [Dyella psychrodurans]